MLEELNFTKEATNVEEFREFLERNSLMNDATAPQIYWNPTAKKCLTMERSQEKIGPIRVGLRKKAKDYFYCTRTRRVGIGTFST